MINRPSLNGPGLACQPQNNCVERLRLFERLALTSVSVGNEVDRGDRTQTL